MKELKTIERAFPQVYEYTQEDGTKAKIVRYGMTMRDYFAAKAMQELIGVLGLTDGTRKAYEWADAMMKERTE
jgi:hypothetical protein